MKYVLHMCCPYIFPVTCLSAKTTNSLINSRKGEVLVMEWDILKERLNCRKTYSCKMNFLATNA